MNSPAVGHVVPVLQAQDGSFVGTSEDGMVAFDAGGNMGWAVPGRCPQIATADGGVVAQAPGMWGCYDATGPGFTFDANGNATGMIVASPTYSWTGNSYQVGSVEQFLTNVICRRATARSKGETLLEAEPETNRSAPTFKTKLQGAPKASSDPSSGSTNKGTTNATNLCRACLMALGWKRPCLWGPE